MDPILTPKLTMQYMSSTMSAQRGRFQFLFLMFASIVLLCCDVHVLMSADGSGKLRHPEYEFFVYALVLCNELNLRLF